MNISTRDILAYLDESNTQYSFIGNKDVNILDYSSIGNMSNNKISWVKNKEFFNEDIVNRLENIILITSDKIDINKSLFLGDRGFIICEDPKAIFFSILNKFFSEQNYLEGIHHSSTVYSDKIGSNVYIGGNCYIEKHVSIGNNVVIKNNVSIEGRVSIGDNTVINSGVVIGNDGFGYFKSPKGINTKVPHFGGVLIGENVEIGTNTCIDRGTLDNTIIGNNVKIDNLCHIAHNVIIKDNCMIVALSMLGGSSIINENSYIAPGVMVKNQLAVGKNSLVGMGSVVVKDVEDNKVVAGVPAKVIRENI